MKLLIENFKHYLKERELIDAITKVDTSGERTISKNTLSKIFKYFHLSSEELAGDEPFQFTPRVPSSPYADNDGNTIEDDFTNRISLAPSIEKALEALETSGNGLEVYAVDFLDIDDDNIPVIPLKAKLKTCPRTPETPYSTDFRMSHWLEDHEDDKEIGSFLKKKKTSHKGLKNLKYSVAPSELPKKWRDQFFGCVPDAGNTNELWTVKPVKMYHIGTYYDDIDAVVLSSNGILVINKYLQKLQSTDDEIKTSKEKG